MPAMKTTDFSGFMTPEEAKPIFDESAKVSVVQGMAQRIPLGETGVAIPVITQKPTAKWVQEGEKKSSSKIGFKRLVMKPHKLATIVPLSEELVRLNPAGAVSQLRALLAEAFARAFDLATMYDLDGDATGTSPFENPLSATSKSITLGTATAENGGIYADLVGGLGLLAADKKRMTGTVLDETMEATLLGAVDKAGRPIFNVDDGEETASVFRRGRLISRRLLLQEAVAHPTGANNVVGFMGDFTKVAWGQVTGINYRVSSEAAVTIDGTLVSAFENNLVLVRAETEIGWVSADKDAFVAIKSA